MKRILAFGAIAALLLTPELIKQKPALETFAANSPTYSSSVPNKNITLKDNTEEEIRSYYSSLNGLGALELRGTNLLKNLKPILQNFTYYSYDAVWKIYEITDREWALSPATSDTYGSTSYDASTATYSTYSYGSSASNPGNDPYVRTLYRNRDSNGVTLEAARIKEWGKHDGTDNATNREHVWCQSRGFKASKGAEGPAGTDVHHLISGDAYVNQQPHNNTPYGFVDRSKPLSIDSANAKSWLSGNIKGAPVTKHTGDQASTVFEPQDSDKGDIARALFYMAACYNNFSGNETITQYNPNLILADYATSDGAAEASSASHAVAMGTLSDLLSWHRMDPVDEYEIHRNNLIYNNYQHNRNPFIDFPEWVDFIWGTTTYDADAHKTLTYTSTPTGSANVATDTINGYNDPTDPSATITSITISDATEKYFVGEAYKFAGKITAHYSDDTSKHITNVPSITTPDLSTAGNKNAIITYKGMVANHSFQAIDADRIEVVTPKTDYQSSEALVKPVVYAYAGEYRRDVTASCSFEGYDPSKSGTQTVTVSLGAKTQTYQVTVGGGSTPSPEEKTPIPLWVIIVVVAAVVLVILVIFAVASKKTKKKAVKALKKAAKGSSKKSSSSSKKKK